MSEPIDSQGQAETIEPERAAELAELQGLAGAEKTAEQAQAEAEAAKPSSIGQDEAEGLSRWAVDTIAAALERHPALKEQYPDAVRAEVAGKLAPVLVKYGDWWPAWFERWKEEIMLFICISGVAYGSVRAVKDWNAEQAASAAAGAGEGETGPGGGP